MEIKIRPLQIEDAKTSVKWRNMSELWTYTTFKLTREITIDDETNWVKKVTMDPTSRRFAILADNVYVGNIYLTGIENGVGEYHIFIGEKDYWGKGIARKASVLIINYGKDELKLNKIKLGVHPENAGALHLYQSLGFTDTGEKEDGFIVMDIDLAAWNGDPRDKIKES